MPLLNGKFVLQRSAIVIFRDIYAHVLMYMADSCQYVSQKSIKLLKYDQQSVLGVMRCSCVLLQCVVILLDKRTL